MTHTHIGTKFYFDLPEYESAEPIGSLPLANQLQAPLKSRLLICEDDGDIATLLSLMLQQGGFVTDIASDAAQAKQLLAQERYAAITVDLALPGQDGISLIRELRDRADTCDLPIVVVSAKADQGQDELSGGGFAVVDWLNKPIDQNRLMAAVRRAVAKRIGGRPRILHVEDDPDVRQVVATVLQNIVEITAIPTLETAMQQLNQMQFDLILLDLTLPDGSGLELLPHLNNHCAGIPPAVVVFSAREVEKSVVNQVAAALVKSRTSNQELVATIRSLIGNNELNE